MADISQRAAEGAIIHINQRIKGAWVEFLPTIHASSNFSCNQTLIND